MTGHQSPIQTEASESVKPVSLPGALRFFMVMHRYVIPIVIAALLLGLLFSLLVETRLRVLGEAPFYLVLAVFTIIIAFFSAGARVARRLRDREPGALRSMKGWMLLAIALIVVLRVMDLLWSPDERGFPWLVDIVYLVWCSGWFLFLSTSRRVKEIFAGGADTGSDEQGAGNVSREIGATSSTRGSRGRSGKLFKPVFLIPLVILALLILICVIDCCLLLRWVADSEIYTQVELRAEGSGYGVFAAREGDGEDGTRVQLLAMTYDSSLEKKDKSYFLDGAAVLDAKRTDTVVMKLDSIILLWEADSAVSYGRKVNYYNDNVGRPFSCAEYLLRQSQQVYYLHWKERKLAHIVWVNYYPRSRAEHEVRLTDIDQVRRIRDQLARYRPVEQQWRKVPDGGTAGSASIIPSFIEGVDAHVRAARGAN